MKQSIKHNFIMRDADTFFNQQTHNISHTVFNNVYYKCLVYMYKLCSFFFHLVRGCWEYMLI